MAAFEGFFLECLYLNKEECTSLSVGGGERRSCLSHSYSTFMGLRHRFDGGRIIYDRNLKCQSSVKLHFFVFRK